MECREAGSEEARAEIEAVRKNIKYKKYTACYECGAP